MVMPDSVSAFVYDDSTHKMLTQDYRRSLRGHCLQSLLQYRVLGGCAIMKLGVVSHNCHNL